MTSGENLRPPGSHMCPQVYLISVRGQTILYWKLDRSGYFCSNGPIYIFNFAFLGTIFVCFVVFFWRNIFLYICFCLFFLIGSDDVIDIVLLWNVFSLCLYLSLGLFISYLYDRFFIGFSLNVIIQSHQNRQTCFLHIFQSIPYCFFSVVINNALKTEVKRVNSF